MFACLVWALCVFMWVRSVLDVCATYANTFLLVYVSVCVCMTDIGSRGDPGWNAEVRVSHHGRQTPQWGESRECEAISSHTH